MGFLKTTPSGDLTIKDGEQYQMFENLVKNINKPIRVSNVIKLLCAIIGVEDMST